MLYLAFQASSSTGAPPDAAALAGMLVIFGAALLFALAINIVICAMLYSCYNVVPPQHHKMQPGLVWLLLIPIFGLVWNFFVYLKLPESYKSYFSSQGRLDVGDCGRGIGLAYAICAACSIVPCVNYLAGPAALVLLIIFLVKVMTLKGQVRAVQQGSAGFPPPISQG